MATTIGVSPTPVVAGSTTHHRPGIIPRVTPVQLKERQIEDYPTGYPRFAALLNSHASFYTFRNFSKLRLRVLLGKQDKLAQLEDRMEEIDDNPDFAVIRGTFRRDINGERDALLALIDKHLADYDLTLERTEKSLCREVASERDVSNVQNWVRTMGQIPRDEAAYLWRDDLITIGASGKDSTSYGFEGPVGDAVIWASNMFNKTLFRQTVSRDPNVYIFSPFFLESLTRALIALMLLLILFVPIVLLMLAVTIAGRVCIAMLACCIFILALSIVAKAKTSELFVAGATYSAILVVFIAGSD